MITSSTQSNDDLDMAFNYVAHTHCSVFLTGKAGTGKTTFLRRVKQNTPKRIAVVAPTGVAAINAGGVTIHSLFQLPFSPYIPNRSLVEAKKYSREKINLIKSIDLLVIDEISMVRCDVLDSVDAVMRQFRNKFKPFGGVQLLLIGDINQLAPVAKDDEWQILQEYYDSVFFFSSHALKENFPTTIELKHIFRQSDALFIDLLNKVRNNAMDDEAYALLNSRLDPEVFESGKDDGYIALTSHNAKSREINMDRLEKLESELFTYRAEIKGDFSPYNFPTEEVLELKLGSQVMFLKNDTAKEKQFFNGKIGKIVQIDEDHICVQTDEYDHIVVGKETWTNIKYTLNPTSKTIEENEIGSFTQFPLKLAWAITIHKSQGLTFDKVIIDAQAAFSSGQVYVALSRCRTLEGIVLSTPIHHQSIRLDYHIHKFNAFMATERSEASHLQKAKFDYQESQIRDLLDFSETKTALEFLHRQVFENTPPLESGSLNIVEKVIQQSSMEIGEVMRAFQKQVNELISKGDLPENNTALKERLKKASEYFEPKISEVLTQPLSKFDPLTENKTIKQNIARAFELVNKIIFIKKACFEFCKGEFSATGFAQTKVNAELDFEKQHKNQFSGDKFSTPKSILHPELFQKLKTMRKNWALENQVEDHKIFNLKALTGLANLLPTHFKKLELVKGIGKVTSRRFGTEIIEAVRAYCEEKNIEPAEPEERATKNNQIVGASASQSLDLYKSGKTIQEIAAERRLTPQTILNHLSPFIASGILDIREFLSSEKLRTLLDYFEKNTEKKMSEAKQELGEAFSYDDLRVFFSYKKHLEAQALMME